MKALNYLEWYLDFWEMNNYNIKIINKVANFYNQPFSVDMLVNPIPMSEVDIFTGKAVRQYQDAESLSARLQRKTVCDTMPTYVIKGIITKGESK